MTDAELFREGVVLTCLGMGVVFAFLSLLVVVTSAMSRLLEHFYPEPPPVVAAVRQGGSPMADPQLLAVITAAIHQHRLKWRNRG